MKIGNLNIDGVCALAPMAGYTDRAFRELCIGFGAGFAVSEMVSTKAIIYDDKKTLELMSMSDVGFPQAIQLFGNNAEDFEKASYKILKYSPSFIDINMGCPVPKIVSSGGGSALMKDPKMCGEIVKAVKRSVNIPVTVKIRKGWNEAQSNAVEVAKICEQSGADALAIHGRTRSQMYSGKASLDIIKKVKEALSIPVIGNGDVTTAQDFVEMREKTGCDMVMIGRGALGNPFLFREINTLVKTDAQIPAVGVSERLYTMMKHIKMLCDYKGEDRGMKEARKHICCYIKGLKNSASYRRRACGMTKFREFEELVKDMYEENTKE